MASRMAHVVIPFSVVRQICPATPSTVTRLQNLSTVTSGPAKATGANTAHSIGKVIPAKSALMLLTNSPLPFLHSFPGTSERPPRRVTHGWFIAPAPARLLFSPPTRARISEPPPGRPPCDVPRRVRRRTAGDACRHTGRPAASTGKHRLRRASGWPRR